MQWHGKSNFRQLSLLTAAIVLVLVVMFLAYPLGVSSHVNLPFQQRISSNTHESGDLQDVFNSTLGFQKIYVIDLPSRTDLRDSMSLAAHFTNLSIDYIDGVTDVNPKALPPGGSQLGLHSGAFGAWRAHMNVLRRMIEDNVQSALVLEGDIDWDLRIKQQMADFARASRLLVQPIEGGQSPKQHLDPSHPKPKEGQRIKNFDVRDEQLSRSITPPSSSPYGDLQNWDLLWLGHCGTIFPPASNKDNSKIPHGRAVIADDDTVPEGQHIKMQFGNRQLMDDYPPHTRVVSRAFRNVCTLGYGISLPGARKFLYELAVREMNGPTDIMFHTVCDGTRGRGKARTCLTVQPQLFQHHRPVGDKRSFSDISDHGDEYNEVAFTRNVRWSTRLNLPKLVEGGTDYIDLFEDGKDGIPDLGFG